MSYPKIRIVGLFDGADNSIISDKDEIGMILTNIYAPDYAVIYVDKNGLLCTGTRISTFQGQTVLVGNNEITIA